ncbi:hypothetical protein DESC_90059 [Desulfosarcina cetonica]|nr:hypothetical protein DESC_90059 [Desulfosarcina cetonica]
MGTSLNYLIKNVKSARYAFMFNAAQNSINTVAEFYAFFFPFNLYPTMRCTNHPPLTRAPVRIFWYCC